MNFKRLNFIQIIKVFLPLSFFALITLSAILIFTPKFSAPYSFTVYSSDGKLLGAAVAEDGQWRFPKTETIPQKYKNALFTYEDKNFYFHLGVDPISILRAAFDNFFAKKIVSGASTITMQTSRLAEKNTKRSFRKKIKETVSAFFLELKYSKEEILALYAANAPYGGNVVGIEAAAWRYFGQSPEYLTWAEAAVLAVLPNQPSLIRPGKQAERLKIKRNKLLRDLFLQKKIDEETYRLSLEEKVPEKPEPLPQTALHYFEFLKKKKEAAFNAEAPAGKLPKVQKYISSINYTLQRNLFEIAEQRCGKFSLSGVHNIAILVLDNETGNILGYIGNSGLNSKYGKNEHVDMVQAKRSSGSLLKPFLFAGLLDAGALLPEQLMIDIPTKIAGYSPQNSTHIYMGAVPACKALSYSLNVPFVRALREFTVPAFLDLLKRAGFTTFTRSAGEYGLPLILGGGEITLFEITENYRKLMQKSLHKSCGTFPFSEAACRLTLDALAESNRPEEESIWQLYSQGQKIAWKTGTSYGNKDAWTVGVTPKYTVGIWCGNATGEGRPEITSTALAAPILFEIFNLLPKSDWPELHKLDFEFIEVCGYSGYPASKFCDNKKRILKPAHAHCQRVCPYCRAVSLTPDGKFQASASDIKDFPKIENRFVLPAAPEYFYMQTHHSYLPLPPYISGSTVNTADEFEILFPENGTNIYIPIELDGSQGALVSQAAHKDPSITIYWDLDGEYLGCTQTYHQMKITAESGTHILTLTDSRGNFRKRTFTIMK